MNTSVLISVTGLDSSKNFEKNVASLINNHITYFDLPELEEIYIKDAGIQLSSGYGQYKEYVTLDLNEKEFKLNIHSTDSQKYDYFKSLELNKTFSNKLKSLILRVIEDNLEYIENKLNE